MRWMCENNFTFLRVLPFILILGRECRSTETKSIADVLVLDLQSSIMLKANNTLTMTLIRVLLPIDTYFSDENFIAREPRSSKDCYNVGGQ